MSLHDYEEKFRRLNVSTAHGRTSPHKICMLLALLDMARSGVLTDNRIEFSPPLLERYEQYFSAVRTPGDHLNPWLPYFHLQGRLRGGSASFWHLRAIPGREAVLAGMDTARNFRAIADNVDCAYVDEELFRLLQEPEAVESLAGSLAREWFNRDLADLGAVTQRCAAISHYERRLRGLERGRPGVSEAPAFVRDPAFRRVVTEVYDYRCAATGVRMVLPEGRALVEAAHILPFAESGDDDPRNGLALTRDLHWAMDNGLVSPTPEFRWKVSPVLDPRIPDHRFLTSIDGTQLILPRDQRWWPRQDVLEWRMSQLRGV